MTYDEVLGWMSEREHGSLHLLQSVLQAALPVAGGPGWRTVLDDMAALGHVTHDSRRWQVARPTLNQLADGGGNAVLTGARPRWLTTALADLVDGVGPWEQVSNQLLENQVVPQEGPSTLYFALDSQADLTPLETSGVRVVSDLSGRTVAGLESGLPFERRTVRPGEPAGRLEMTTLRNEARWDFVAASRDDEPGVYRYLRHGSQRVFAVRRTNGWDVGDLRWCVWSAASWRERLALDLAGGQLCVHGAVRLPMEIERALVLRTGRLPAVSPGRRTYSNITHRLATRVARLLKKEPVLI